MGGGFTVRSSELAGPELAGELQWRTWFARLATQPAASFDLDGRPVRVQPWSGVLGYRPSWMPLPALELFATAGVAVERWSVRRTDLAGRTHHALDLGAVAGGGVVMHSRSGLGLGLWLEGLVTPAARELVIPEGPTKSLGRWGGRGGLFVSWRLNVAERTRGSLRPEVSP